VQTVADRIAASPANDDALHLMLLLRSSRDERADEIRRRTLRSFSERIASLAGWVPGKAGGDELLLRAEVAISMSLGIAMLRTSSGLEPLASATSADLTGAISDAFSALLAPRAS
jgi:hypothetical protein